MILNSGLDNAAKSQWNPAGASNNSFWTAFAAYGTGTTAPDVSQTTLVSEAARSGSDGGFPVSITYLRDTSANVFRATVINTRVFNITGSVNATEYGWTPASTSGVFTWRDLFRDDPNNPASTPVTLSLQNGDQLQIIMTQIVEIPWLTVSESFTMTGFGTVNGQATFYGTTDALITAVSIMNAFWPGGSAQSVLLRSVTAAASTARDTGLSALLGAANAPVLTSDAYTDGDYFRTRRATFGTSGAVGNLTAVAIAPGVVNTTAAINHGYKFVFDSAFTKASTHTLELVHRVEWERG